MKLSKRCLLLLSAGLLAGCMVVPYSPYPYAVQGPTVYVAPAPYYVVPSTEVYFGYGGGRGWRR
jgi:hypothetical protein